MPIELKGSNFTLLVIYLYESKPEIIRKALADKIAQAPFFLRSAPVVINVSHLTSPISWNYLYQAVIDVGLRIVGVSGCEKPELKKEIERTGLSLLTEGKNKVPCFSDTTIKVVENPVQIVKSRLIHTPVRSGQRIYAPNCDLIVTNNVSAGAELIADGNIHVYGMLSGRALAGASRNVEAQIFCTNLTAELVAIAGEYWLSDNIPTEFYGKAARLSLANHSLVVQPLN